MSAKLRQANLLATTYGARNVRMDLEGPLRAAWERGHVSVADVWSYYRRYPYLTRLRDRPVLEGALRAGLEDMMWESEGFALTESYDDAIGRYRGLASYTDGSVWTLPDTAPVAQPKVAAAKQAADRNAVLGPDETGDQAGWGEVSATVPEPAADATTDGTIV